MKTKTKLQKHLKRLIPKVSTRRRLRHLLTRKKLLKRPHARHLGRTLFIFVATACTGSLAFAIATTKPTVNLQIQTHGNTKITTIAPPLIIPNAPDQAGSGSWYAYGLPEPDKLSCASTTFARGTYLKVTNRRNGKSVVCLVNDYGPEPWTNRVIDLSRGSFRVIEDLGAGTAPVEIRVVPPPPSSINIPLSSSHFGQFIGYALCRNQHTAQFCEQNRQER